MTKREREMVGEREGRRVGVDIMSRAGEERERERERG